MKQRPLVLYRQVVFELYRVVTKGILFCYNFYMNINDWAKIKTEYVTSNVTYDELAAKYGVSKRAVYMHGSKEEWVKERQEYCRSIADGVIQNSASEEIDRLNSLKTASNNLADYINKKIENLVVNNEDISVRAIKDYVTALKDLVPTVRSLYNIETISESEARQIAKERLELEKKKYDSGQMVTEVNVTFGDGADDYAR